MKKKCMTVLMVALFVGGMMLPNPVLAQAQEEEDAVTQGELAMIMVNVLGLAGELPIGATEFDAIALLLANGIEPMGGWDIGRPVLLADLAVILVKSLGAADTVADPDSPQSWIDAANALGIDLSTVRGATAGVLAGSEDMADQFFRLDMTTDPVDRPDAGSPVETTWKNPPQFIGAFLPVSLADVIRVLPSLPAPTVPSRPTPVTPD